MRIIIILTQNFNQGRGDFAFLENLCYTKVTRKKSFLLVHLLFLKKGCADVKNIENETV